MKEIWMPIPGYDGFYLASNLGRIKSKERISGNGNLIPEAIKIQRPNKGYLVVSIKYKNVKLTLKVHRLVMMAFHGDQKNMQVNHIDGNKSNNAVSNLEWATAKENARHAHSMGLIRKKIGKENHLSKPILQLSQSGKLIRKWDSITLAANHIGVKISSLSSCLRGKSKTSGNFKWQYQ